MKDRDKIKIENWLKRIKLEKYLQNFVDNSIKPKKIFSLKDDDLVDIGIGKKEDRNIILSRIAKDRFNIRLNRVIVILCSIGILVPLFTCTYIYFSDQELRYVRTILGLENFPSSASFIEACALEDYYSSNYAGERFLYFFEGQLILSTGSGAIFILFVIFDLIILFLPPIEFKYYKKEESDLSTKKENTQNILERIVDELLSFLKIAILETISIYINASKARSALKFCIYLFVAFNLLLAFISILFSINFEYGFWIPFSFIVIRLIWECYYEWHAIFKYRFIPAKNDFAKDWNNSKEKRKFQKWISRILKLENS